MALAGVLNRCCWFEAQYGRPQRMAFATSPAFVDHVWQLLGALLSGEALACFCHETRGQCVESCGVLVMQAGAAVAVLLKSSAQALTLHRDRCVRRPMQCPCLKGS